MRFSGDTIGRKTLLDVVGVFPLTINPIEFRFYNIYTNDKGVIAVIKRNGWK